LIVIPAKAGIQYSMALSKSVIRINCLNFDFFDLYDYYDNMGLNICTCTVVLIAESGIHPLCHAELVSASIKPYEYRILK